MATCRRLRPILFRLVEGEATPEEALLAGRHLPRCTGCRILLARERRLGSLLDGVDDPLPVEADFLGKVMDAIPAGPPPGADRAMSRRRRGLRLLGSLGVLILAAGLAARLSAPALDPIARIPRAIPGVEGLEGSLAGAGGAARLLLATLVGAGTQATLEIPSLPRPHVAMAMLAPLFAALLAATSTAAVIAARSLYRSGASPSAGSLASRAVTSTPSRRAVETRSPADSASIRRT
jgi:hypothetical protein